MSNNYAQLERMLRTERNRSADKEQTRLNTLLHTARGITRITGADTTAKTSDGATISATVYGLDLAAGNALIGGFDDVIAALVDQDLLDPAEIKSYDLAGAQAVALADNTDVYVTMAAIMVSGALEIRAIFGAAAATGTAVDNTAPQCFTALKLAAITGYNSSGLGLIFGRLLIDRVGAAVSYTHSDPAVDRVLKAERLAGALA